MEHYELSEEEMDTSIVTKKIKKTKARFLNRIFDIKQIKKFIEKHNLERLLLVILIILVFSHISYGYTINLHRTLLLIMLISSFIVLFLLYNLIKSTNFFTELIKNPTTKPFVSLTFIFIFIIFCLIFNKIIPYKKLEKYKFSIPRKNI